MKKILLVLVAMPFFAFQCKKDRDQNGWLEGKVVRISCASFIVQVLNNDDIGQDGWKDIMDNDKMHDDVINASNKCEIPETVKPGNIIRFKIEEPRTHNDCAICLIYDAPPDKAYEIKKIELKENH